MELQDYKLLSKKKKSVNISEKSIGTDEPTRDTRNVVITTGHRQHRNIFVATWVNINNPRSKLILEFVNLDTRLTSNFVFLSHYTNINCIK